MLKPKRVGVKLVCNLPARGVNTKLESHFNSLVKKKPRKHGLEIRFQVLFFVNNVS